MPTAKLLSETDIDELSFRATSDENPARIASSLLTAVDENRVPEPTDRVYALSVAADIYEQTGDYPAALTVAQRAVEAAEADEPDNAYPINLRAIILGRLGRADEAIVTLEPLRPRFATEGELAVLVSDTLEDLGHAQLAIEWLTAALDEALPNGTPPEDPERSADAYFLLQRRHRIREDLELPHDDYDHLADRLAEALEEANANLPDYYAEVYFPEAELAALYLRYPDIANAIGKDWDEQRAGIEGALTELAEEGETALAIAIGTADGYTAFLTDGGDPADPEVLGDYAYSLTETTITWPPERNDDCWCGSGVKYKKCCRTRQA